MLTLNYQEEGLSTANLHFESRRIAKLSRLAPAVIDISGIHAPERTRVEDFIRAIYKMRYDADIHVDYPALGRDENTDPGSDEKSQGHGRLRDGIAKS